MERNSPIAVFDSGIGSYSIVRVLHRALPNEHIVYLADRASFPYGDKTHDELKNIVVHTILWLEHNYKPKLVVIASNTPSVQVLSEIRNEFRTPLIGVFPPIEEAVKRSRSKHIAILATKAGASSPELDYLIKNKDLPKNARIHKINASALVALVESGTFQADPSRTEAEIRSVIDAVFADDALIDVMTLSSTHLPFLSDYLVALYPTILFIDPAEYVAKDVRSELAGKNLLSEGPGSITVLATGRETRELETILGTVGLNIKVKSVMM